MDFQKLLQESQTLEQSYQAKIRKNRSYRILVFFLFFTIPLFCLEPVNFPYCLVVPVLLIAALVFLIFRESDYLAKKNKARSMADVCQKYLDRISGSWDGFEDTGKEFIQNDHPYSSDLDLFGNHSLFQLINITKSFFGRRALKQALDSPELDRNHLLANQEAIRELFEKKQLCMEMESIYMLSSRVMEDPESLLSFAEEKNEILNNSIYPYLVVLLPGFFWSLVVLVAAGFPIPIFFPGVVYILQSLLWMKYYGDMNGILSKVHGFRRDLGAFSGAFTLVEKTSFVSAKLNEIQKHLKVDGLFPSSYFRKLDGIADSIELRQSPLMYFVLNTTLLWDFHVYYALVKWKSRTGKYLRRWMIELGELEALMSFSVLFHTGHPVVFPEAVDDGVPTVRAKQAGHPLLTVERCVKNDFELSGISIITGSNMSGKTTMLRTAGINLVLALAGAPVLAEKFQFSLMRPITSMRIADDLSDGISTFYAELLRMKMILESIQTGDPVIVLIDEIFRGTNSIDRLAGARKVLETLDRAGVLAVLSTHDLELCELSLENGKKPKNYNFSETYIQNKIHFDYRIHTGCCKTSNARYLMRMIGIEIQETTPSLPPGTPHPPEVGGGYPPPEEGS